jgi:hypothetical protein
MTIARPVCAAKSGRDSSAWQCNWTASRLCQQLGCVAPAGIPVHFDAIPMAKVGDVYPLVTDGAGIMQDWSVLVHGRR